MKTKTFAGAPRFLGNGMSRTAMIFKIATMAGHKLTVPELNRIKDVNPRSLERVYDQIIGGGASGDAMFALSNGDIVVIGNIHDNPELLNKEDF